MYLLKNLVQAAFDSKLLSPLWDWAMRQSDERLRRGGWQSNYERFLQDPTRPVWLEIEVTNICNANCTFCGYQFQERKKQKMPGRFFEDIVRQYAEIGGGDIQLTPIVGESLVDPNFAEKVRFARSFPEIGKLLLTTNAILLSREKYEELVEAGLNHITISMTGFDREEYMRIYRKDHLPLILDNLRSISQSPMFKDCPVELSLRSDDFKAEKRPVAEEFRRLGFGVSKISSFDNWGNRIKGQDLSGSMLVKPNRADKSIPCSVLYDGPMITVGGRMTACGCRDLNADSELYLGTFPETSIAAPYADGTVEAIRQRFRDGDPPAICRSCRHYRPAY